MIKKVALRDVLTQAYTQQPVSQKKKKEYNCIGGLR
jgi:hypothetical protein